MLSQSKLIAIRIFSFIISLEVYNGIEILKKQVSAFGSDLSGFLVFNG